ncbi:Major Facilitator Superfamily protein [Poriferisphaera corsica]|uniref:Major Facilitator Superfamily protein n=1 Tax=Poriferisphaera corsica TaxID=2528020 RepID=A0A517YX19_9BACT|nr:MFS transporter [Poriferisphaera corsica]QDU34756.1 Major Facilitator Superfamily protein [Poriferisphaera corsica]
MIFHFSLYGFLKNQRYFEPFLMLALLDKRLSFFWIGLLIGIREVATNVMEIPTGAFADTLGRRYAMIASHVAYIGAFICLGLFRQFGLLAAAMLMFSIGEAFRTGTHKAMIFSWLKANNKLDEKKHIYGYTRSWSKMGTAVGALIAAGLLLVTQRYDWVFYMSAVPMAFGIVNFLCYPSCVESPTTAQSKLLKQGECSHDEPMGGYEKISVGRVVRTLWNGIKKSWVDRKLRALLIEDVTFEAMFKATKDYLQPILQAAAVAVPVGALMGIQMTETQRTVVLVAVVYAVLSVMASIASRRSGKFSERFENDALATKAIWSLCLCSFAVVGMGVLMGWYFAIALGFVAVAVFQNLWRPLLISRISNYADDETMATVLSVESQGKTMLTAVMAPLLGLAVDWMMRQEMGNEAWQYGPIVVLGLGVCLWFRFAGKKEARKIVSQKEIAAWK